MKELTTEYSRDTLFNGRLLLFQPVSGYRFSVDAPLLVWFASQGGRTAQRCADVGAGCGVVGLGLLLAGSAKRVTAIEVQPRLADLARLNATTNGLEETCSLYYGDVRKAALETELGRQFDLVVSNPPYWPTTEGQPPDNDERRIACQEALCTATELIAASAKLVEQRQGRLCMIYPARRLDSVILAMQSAKLGIVRIGFVHPLADRSAEFVLIEARPGAQGGHLEVQAPLVLKHSDGADTPEAADILCGVFSPALAQLPDQRT